MATCTRPSRSNKWPRRWTWVVWTLNRHLRRTLNTSAYAYVVARRIARARQLLRLGEMSLKAIAAATGFSDQAHMTRLFRARLGITPGQYRSQS